LDLKVLLGGRGHGLSGGHPECEPYQHRERLPAHTRSVRRLCQFGYREPPSGHIGKMQMAAGAVGITCQKLGEV
jgi:hypothetical protein